ncbi:MAG: tRNA (cytidine(34)-2'-O)-methyltransferase [Pseudomonadota bacterium]
MNPEISGAQKKVIEDPVLNVALYQPEIPANTGNIARLCGAAEVPLHLIHPLGFQVDDKHLKRAGLDYWSEVDITHHVSYEAFLQAIEGSGAGKIIAFSRHASQNYTQAEIHHGDYLLFGPETRGLPLDLRTHYPFYRIPIWGRVRSLNLSTAVGIAVYHYLYRLGKF